MKGRNPKLIILRNKALIARFYYWTEIQRRRFDDVIEILEHNEFFLTSTQITRIIRADDKYYDQLFKSKISLDDLEKEFPAFQFRKAKVDKPSKKQLKLELG